MGEFTDGPGLGCSTFTATRFSPWSVFSAFNTIITQRVKGNKGGLNFDFE